MNYQQAYKVFTDIFSGKTPSDAIEKTLRELAHQGETFEEIAGAAQAMREYSIPIHSSVETFDVCGTGGSGENKPFNISTTSSIILASQGVCIAKHGNRAASSISGSADVLEELGIEISMSPKKMEESLKKK